MKPIFSMFNMFWSLYENWDFYVYENWDFYVIWSSSEKEN